MAEKILLGYWDARGLAQTIRNILEYTNQEYEEKIYVNDLRDPNNRAQISRHWLDAKKGAKEIIGGDDEVAFDFPNLPYLIETRKDGTKLKLTQSVAILKHIARQHGLVAEEKDEIARMEMFERQVSDLITIMIEYSYDASHVVARFSNYSENIKPLIEPWEKVLEGKKWLLGDKLTYVDFLLYEILDWHVLLEKNILDSFPSLKSFHQRFRKLPKIKEYFASDRYKEWPLFTPMAKNFGYHRKQ